jgi:hypothetical protein
MIDVGDGKVVLKPFPTPEKTGGGEARVSTCGIGSLLNKVQIPANKGGDTGVDAGQGVEKTGVKTELAS